MPLYKIIYYAFIYNFFVQRTGLQLVIIIADQILLCRKIYVLLLFFIFGNVIFKFCIDHPQKNFLSRHCPPDSFKTPTVTTTTTNQTQIFNHTHKSTINHKSSTPNSITFSYPLKKKKKKIKMLTHGMDARACASERKRARD
jgi:hypothetical protein